MQVITINGEIAKWDGRDLTILGYEIVDTEMLHIFFNDCVVAFKAGDTEINGVIKNTIQEIIDSIQ